MKTRSLVTHWTLSASCSAGPCTDWGAPNQPVAIVGSTHLYVAERGWRSKHTRCADQCPTRTPKRVA